MATSSRIEVTKSSTCQVSFICQRCCQPLKLEPSFYCMDPSVYSELKGFIFYSFGMTANSVFPPVCPSVQYCFNRSNGMLCSSYWNNLHRLVLSSRIEVIKNKAFQVNFICKWCCQPLKLEPPFYCMHLCVYSELKGFFFTVFGVTAISVCPSVRPRLFQ